MTTLMQWVHVTTAVIGIGGMGFLLVVLMPSLQVLSPEQREALARAVQQRFRWVSWSAIFLLLTSGLYNVSQFYWERPWGRAWFFLTIKILLAFVVFGISLGLTLPLGYFERLRQKRKLWLAVAFGTGLAVIFISAYLRRG